MRALGNALGSRHSSRFRESKNEPNEGSPRPCHGHRFAACDVVPAGSWATCCDRSAKCWLGHFSSRCSLSRQSNGQRYRQESNLLLPGCSRPPHHLAPVPWVSVLAGSRTRSSTFARSRARSATLRGHLVAQHPAEESDPVLRFRRPPCYPVHLQGNGARRWQAP